MGEQTTRPSSLEIAEPAQLFVPRRVDPRCKICRQLISSKLRSPPSTFEHYTYLDLKISAARDCPLCRFLFNEIILQAKQQNLQIQLLATRTVDRLKLVDYTRTSVDFEIYTQSGNTKHSMPLLTKFRPIASHVDSDECWTLVKTWISNCDSHHSTCAKSKTENPLPPRILDVSDAASGFVRVSDSRGLSGLFAALSYTWGMANTMTCLTRATFGYFSHGIDIVRLPKTFQDAIQVVQKLGIQYLWIDALCIIQDDLEDWQREASQMGRYYQDCTINISALSVPSNNIGFLLPRILLADGQLEEGVFIRRSRPKWREVFRDSPLSKRSWVLQERLMSTRALHFGDGELFWECMSSSTRESNCEEYTLQGKTTAWADENFKRSLLFTTSDADQIMETWYRVVSQYSALDITFLSDIFPAIAGIASEFQKATDFRYVAGLWYEHLHSGLLWHYSRGGTLSTSARPDGYAWTAPTWSWASVHRPVQMLYTNESTRVEHDFDAKFLEVNCETQGFNKLGALKSASMRLHALCVKVWCKSAHASQPFNDPDLALCLDIYDSNGLMIGTGWRDFIGSDLNTKAEHCLAILIAHRLDPDFGADPIQYFLLIAKVAGRDDEVYERIGIGQTADPYYGNIVSKTAFRDCEWLTVDLV